MLTVSVTFDLTLLYFVAANVAAILIYALVLRYRARKAQAATVKVTNAISEYFAGSGADISIRCLPQSERNHYLAFIDSEPLKRFRYSHIVEASLINHVEKIHGYLIDRVYWRFPLPAEKTDKPTAAENSIIKQDDEYISQGLLRAKSGNDYSVAEGSWDQFEKASQHDKDAPEASSEEDARKGS